MVSSVCLFASCGVDHTKREFLRQETTSGGRVVAMWG